MYLPASTISLPGPAESWTTRSVQFILANCFRLRAYSRQSFDFGQLPWLGSKLAVVEPLLRREGYAIAYMRDFDTLSKCRPSPFSLAKYNLWSVARIAKLFCEGR